MFSSSDILYGVLLPLLLATAILLIAWRPWKRGAETPAHWGGPLAIGLAFCVGFGLIVREQLFPLSGATPRLVYIGLAFTILGLVDSLLRLPLWLRMVLVFLLTVASAAFLLWFKLNLPPEFGWSRQVAASVFVEMGIGAVILWLTFEVAAKGGGLLAPLSKMVVVGASALVVAAAAEQTTGQGIGTIAVALTVAIVLAAWSGRASLERGCAMVVSGVLVLSLAGAFAISDLPISLVRILLATPLILWIGQLPPIRRWRPWVRVLVLILLLMIPLGIAAAIAIAERPKADDTYSELPAARWLLATGY